VGWNPITFTDPTGRYSEEERDDEERQVYSAETVEYADVRTGTEAPIAEWREAEVDEAKAKHRRGGGA